MDYPIHIDTIQVWNCPFCILRSCLSKFQQYDVFLSLKIVFILAKSADPDEMLPYVAFQLGLHCLPKYLLMLLYFTLITMINLNSKRFSNSKS